MKSATWRALILALCGLTTLAAIAEFFGAIGMGGAPPWLGIWGNTVAASPQAYDLTIQSVDPGGPSERAALRPGDLVDLRASNLIDRFSLLGQPLNGRSVTLSIRRGSSQATVVVTPRPADLRRRWDAFFNWPGIVWIALLAALVAWRRSHLREMRLLCLALVSYALWEVTAPFAFAAPWPWVYVAFRISGALWGPLALAFWAACASCFAAPLSKLRRGAAVFCYILVAASVVLGGATVLGYITLWFDPVSLSSPAASLPFALALLTALGCSVLAIEASRGIERARAAWLLVPLALLFLVRFVLDTAAGHLSSYADFIAISYVYSTVLFATPLVVAYVALSRRLIDVGFVLNRAAVFGIASSIVIGAFILVEWAASQWLVSASHTTSVVVGMVVALALGLSLRYIHKYVDTFVDRVFFRKRHEDEAALRRFAHESSYITDRGILLDRAVQEVLEHTNARDATIFVRDGTAGYTSVNDSPADVGENDPGIVALKAWSKQVNLHLFSGSELQGEVAFPMTSRGDLLGALICGPKRDGEAYAPDESDALLALARGVGTALDTLSKKNDGAIESLRETQEQMLEELRGLARKINRLADSLLSNGGRDGTP